MTAYRFAFALAQYSLISTSRHSGTLSSRYLRTVSPLKVSTAIHYARPKYTEADGRYRCEAEKSHLRFQWNIFPNRYHYFEIVDKESGKKSYSKAYTGGDWGKDRGHPLWTTYRWMLEAIVERVKTGKEPAHWIDLEESVEVMDIIDNVYKKAGLPIRGA